LELLKRFQTEKQDAKDTMFHRKGDVNRLYISRKDGGTGLISVEDCV